jgi:hypothetical protein|mmetsp:Transcript_29274/g.62142  ORF Transcript_29274/g.62142 Transcript_29274/m.62142 type:complete len:168 (-) Transcript_29274:28-531(-)|eukprot:CAMPEP_0172539600 /NCGR_PEP_ID=MMETSP1067-20121228/10773_1 /TAXON_ID=265564 ORGANISM="Thalassiosira punctigera, Strain Tpunct2005C2" /NCGR_SAMPLE_ID=MMETSP1067 /ASSEMBLY_ACC=CAM_ASM_000444 /LENGTH=167 /DNA_ID=CAMNT_0013325311 /DNA_START=289 /DNA_END=792 /DNA_ORIENTATION=+
MAGWITTRRRGRDDVSIKRASEKAKRARRERNRRPRRSSNQATTQGTAVVRSGPVTSPCSAVERVIKCPSATVQREDTPARTKTTPATACQKTIVVSSPPKDSTRVAAVSSVVRTPRPYLVDAMRRCQELAQLSAKGSVASSGVSSLTMTDVDDRSVGTVIQSSLPY